MSVPYTFATATGSLPLSQLDANFATGIVIGNTTVALGDTITTINNLTLANVTVTSASFSNVTLIGTTTVASNTTVFSATGARIQGDFSTGTFANRTAFQDKTTNNGTSIYALPNGTATESYWNAFNKSDPANSGYVGIGINSSEAALYTSKQGTGGFVPLTIQVGGAEVARFWTTGQLSLNSSIFPIATGYGSRLNIAYAGAGNEFGIALRPAADTTTAIAFIKANGDAVGSISQTTSGVSYNTFSDYRLKNNSQPLTGSGAFIDALQPKTWNWLHNNTPGVGFIAHEVAAVSPSSVWGEKDSVDGSGNPIYQAMEYGSAEFIANIVAELQSLRARVAALEAA